MTEIPNRPPTLEELAHSKLLSYVAYQFPQYVIGQMHLLIAAYLEAVERGDITRLMIWAPPRHGKCCDINSLLHMADGTLKRAGDAKVGDSIFGYDDGKLCTQTILATEPTRKLSKQITTRTGRSFIGSADHPLLTFDGYKRLSELTLNDFLVTLHKEIDFNYEIDLNELKFITYMLFDGSCSAKHGRSFSKLDPIVIADFRKLCELFGITFTKSAGSDCDYYVGVQAIPLLQKYGIADEKSTTKRLPKEFFKVSLKQKWEFINIMFQTDGYFAQKAGQGGITLANKKLIQDIQTLLSMCGIATAMFYKPNDCSNAWGLTIGRSQLQKIYDNCDLGSKREQCAKILEKQGLSMIEAFPNKLGKTLKHTRENGFRCDNKKNITRERLERMAKVYPELNWYLEMDFIYDQIINIQNVGMRDLVHLQTTNTENYIANGIVSHNTALVGEYFPAWYLGRNPEHHIIYTTYNQERGNDVGRRVRDQAISENFQRIFPNCNVLKDSKAISHFSTMQKGEYFNVGMGGAIVGRGANCLPAETILSVEIDGAKKELDIETVYSIFNQFIPIKVLSFNHRKGIPIYKNILAVKIRTANELVQITTESDIELRLTKNHPVFTLMNSYVASEFLQIGDRTIISNPLKFDAISTIKRISTNSISVYDIQVEGTSNFFANKILTHNCLIIDDPIKDRQEAESKTARKNVQNWYQAVAYTRVMPGGKIVVINTRWHCFSEGTEILTTDGWIAAKDINKEHLFITQNGIEPIERMESKHFDGPMYEFTLYGTPKKLKVTGNHKILTADGWKYAEQLTKNDWLIVPNMLGGEIPKFEPAKESVATNDGNLTGVKNKVSKAELKQLLDEGKTYDECAWHFGYSGKGTINKYITLYGLNRNTNTVAPQEMLDDPNFWRFVGYWLAEGSLSKVRKHYGKDNYTIIVLTIGTHEQNIIDDLKQIMERYNIHVSTCLHKCKTATKVQFSCWQIAQYLKTHFGQGADHKQLPEWIGSLPIEYKKELLIGYFRGDGCFGNKLGYRATSVSLKLITDIQRLLAGMNIPSGIMIGGKKGTCVFKIKGQENRVYNTKDAYELRVHEAYIPWMNIEREKYEIRKNKPTYVIGKRIIGNQLQLKVKKIDVSQYNGLIYDFETKSHTITAAGAVVHNSNDLSGYLMEEHSHENWAILDLKAIAEPGDIMNRKEGEALWPEFRDLEQLEIIKTALGPREWNAQFQQRPTALGGGRVKFEWINHYEQLPKPDEIQRIVASWDTAYKPEQINDPTACTVWIITATGYYLIDVRNKRLEFPDLVKEVQLVHEIHHPSAHLIEGRATGQSLIQELKRSTRIPTVEISTKNINNEIRFDAITTLFESGKVWFPKQAHWLSETEDQICSFPTAPHDDIADSTSQFLNWVNKPRYVPRPPSKLYWK